jgi:predicted dehydrogenase
VKALVVGLGGIGQRHVRNLRSLLGDRLELHAYRTRRLRHVITPQLSADAQLDVETVYDVHVHSRLADALAVRPDIALITNPSSLHVEAALECAEAGCDLFIEKPLSSSIDGTEQLIERVNQSSLVAMVGYQLRFHPGLEHLSKIVRAGRLGKLLAVRATIGEYLPNWHRYEDYRQMYAARSELGGGVVFSQIHEYDYLYSLFGMPERLFAIGGHWSSLEIDVEDTASVLMECTVDGRPLPVHVQQDFLRSPPSRSCEIVGDRGSAVLDFQHLQLTENILGEGKPVVNSFSGFERNELFLRELEHFLNCVARREQPVVTLADGLASLKIAISVKESMRSGAVVDLREAGIVS